jgi:hypothetical protein
MIERVYTASFGYGVDDRSLIVWAGDLKGDLWLLQRDDYVRGAPSAMQRKL